MYLKITGVHLNRGEWSLTAEGVFSPGINLITGGIGSGKSTLAWLLGGALVPDSGIIQKDGIMTSVLSMQFPEYHVTSSTVSGEIRSWGINPEDILLYAGLPGMEERNVSSLSRGQLKKLHLSCLLFKRQDLLILDEPYASLDDHARRWLSDSLEQFTDRICILITHDLACLPEVDALWEMENGRLISHGPFPGAWNSWKNPPPLIREILIHNRPLNISRRSLEEATCRIRE